MSQNLRVPGPVRKLDLRVFQHATEDRGRVLGALAFVSGTEKFRETRAEGHHGNPISIFETEVASRRDMERFWDRVRAAGLFPGLEENLEERVNDEGELFLRFDKQQAVEGRLGLSASDDVIAGRARVFTVVNGREVRAGRGPAIAEIRRFFGGVGENETGNRQQAAGSGQQG